MYELPCNDDYVCGVVRTPSTTSVMGEDVVNQKNGANAGTFGWYSYEILADDTIKITKCNVILSITKKFNKKKTITRKVTKAIFTIKNKILQKKKVLYVKARAYKVLNGKIYYSKWSNVKKVVIKK